MSQRCNGQEIRLLPAVAVLLYARMPKSMRRKAGNRQFILWRWIFRVVYFPRHIHRMRVYHTNRFPAKHRFWQAHYCIMGHALFRAEASSSCSAITIKELKAVRGQVRFQSMRIIGKKWSGMSMLLKIQFHIRLPRLPLTAPDGRRFLFLQESGNSTGGSEDRFLPLPWALFPRRGLLIFAFYIQPVTGFMSILVL